MKIRLARMHELKNVTDLVQKTIEVIYPQYYPSGAIEFFLQHHHLCNIEKDLRLRQVYILEIDNQIRGTVTVKENEICRLFVLPKYQGNGYGKALIRYSEKQIKSRFEYVFLDASLPAKAIYLKYGYHESSFKKIKMDNGDYLCYDVMCKMI